MGQEFLSRIFEPFVQAETDARSVYQGTGLGMSIAKALIGQMGGTLDISVLMRTIAQYRKKN